MTTSVRLSAYAVLATLLGAAPLAAVFSDDGWLFPVAGAVLTVGAVGALARRLRLPSLVQVVVEAAAATAYLVAVYAPSPAWGHVIPRPATLQQWRVLWHHGMDDIAQLTAPVPTHRGVLFITVVALAAVAIVVDIVAVTLRRPAVAGLALLGVFAVPAAVAPHGVGPVPFLLSAAGWLALLLADGRDRLARWGRWWRPGRPGDAAADEPAAVPMGASARRIGAAALGVSVLVAAVLPSIGHQPWGNAGEGIGLGRGPSTVTTFNPLVQIRSQLDDRRVVPLLRVTTDDKYPGYLRMTTLDRFDGETWSASPVTGGEESRVSNGLPAISSMVASTPVHSQVRVSDLAVHWLPVPFPTTRVSVRGDWRYDAGSQTVFSARDDTRGLSYTVTSVHMYPSPEELRSQPAPDPAYDPYLLLPVNLPPEVTALARQVTRGAASAFDRAVAIQDYLRSPPFVYDTQVPEGNGSSALLNFLQSKRGFCEQYAATMAVMARAVGIPARVAVGFTAGRQQTDGTWLITNHDAHAWPELYFPDAGWLQFEPTPRSDGLTAPPAFTVPTATAPGAARGQANPSRADGSRAPGLDRKLDGLDRAAPRTGDASTGAHRSGAGWMWWLALAFLVILLAAPALARRLVRVRRWNRAREPAGAALAAWAEVRDSALDLGRPWPRGGSPRQVATRLAEAAGFDVPTQQALDRLTRLVEKARYARRLPAIDRDGVAADVARVRRGLARTARRRRRFRATVLPLSTLRLLTSLAGRAGAALDRVDVAPYRARAALVRRTAAARGGLLVGDGHRLRARGSRETEMDRQNR